MAETHGFEHLRLLFREDGPARFPPAPNSNAATQAARADRPGHANNLRNKAQGFGQAWKTTQTARSDEGKPTLPAGVPLLLQIDEQLDIDALTAKLGFEVVSEEADGFVIVASEDLDLTTFLQQVDDFGKDVHGSGIVASVHSLDEDETQDERLKRILSETLYAEWPNIPDDREYVCDIGISCSGNWLLPKKPNRNPRWKQSTWAKKEAEWATARSKAYDDWERLQTDRLSVIREFVNAYQGAIEGIVEDIEEEDEAGIPDSFSIRLRIVGQGLKDLVLNCAYVFEVLEPDDIETPQEVARSQAQTMQEVVLTEPAEDAPSVCVIDSGIQEGHFWLSPAVDNALSLTMIQEVPPSIADHVSPSGHGTRVAGAVLYGDTIPTAGTVPLLCWILNARVLDAHSSMPRYLFPPETLRRVVKHYHDRENPTRIFNHSINADAPCRTRHMSAWAAEIDRLSFEYDILVVQSVGNVPFDRAAPKPGLIQQLAAGKHYPDLLDEPAHRLANPAQSLQALTVGSIARVIYDANGWKTFATEPGMPSAFSRSGLGLWDSIKPEVVEFGGEALYDTGNPPRVSTPTGSSACYPELLRATATGGPAYSRDEVGTSYATPMVTRIAAVLQSILPDHPCLLYRALIVQSARWPSWSDALDEQHRAALLRHIGYGIPDLERATSNTDYRTTFITEGEREIGPGDCHVYQVRVPEVLRAAGTDYDVRVEATLSYAAEPRRTRRRHRGYLSAWVDWMSSRKDERLDAFLTRAMKQDEQLDEGSSFGWSLGRQPHVGSIPGARRTTSTVQKDWATVKSNQLPEDLCFAVRGHRGWSKDPDASARYVFTVTIELVGQEIEIYEPLRVAVEELEAELGITVQSEVEVEES